MEYLIRLKVRYLLWREKIVEQRLAWWPIQGVVFDEVTPFVLDQPAGSRWVDRARLLLGDSDAS